MKISSAFTLAEVLITLGIIGVVAALTLPALINNTQHKELQTALNKNYSVLQQALLSMSKDNGDSIKPTTYDSISFMNNFKNYVNYIRYCSYKGCIDYENEPDNDSNPYYIKNYRIYNKSKNISTKFFDDGQLILNDGSLIMIEHFSGSDYLYITVDVNGFNKRPNTWGHDLFTFQLTDDGKLLPMGAEGTDYYQQESSYCSVNSNNSLNGIACTNNAINDNNYWKNLP